MKNLVNAMAWEHPTRTLDIGTMNSNATRVLNRNIDQLGSPAFLPLIKSSLSRVVHLSSQVKRTCQRAIGQYIEKLALHNIDGKENEGDDAKEDNNKEDNNKEYSIKEYSIKEEPCKKDGESEGGVKKVLDPDDRVLLNILCPGFSNKDLANFSKDEMEQEPTAQESTEGVDDSGDKRIYSSSSCFAYDTDTICSHSITKYWENLYAGSDTTTFSQGTKAWMSEAAKYNYANPVFSGATCKEVKFLIIIVCRSQLEQFGLWPK